MKPDTKGIFLWNEAFHVQTECGKIAVLLMDTQGLFEQGTEGNVNAKILALSTLLSSVQIINVFHQIQVDDLEYLRFFVDYTSASLDSENSQLQQLVFLVRDWTNPDEYDYGEEGGKLYLNQELERVDSNSETSNYIREFRGIFSDLKCFLLPNPMNCKPREFVGRFEQLDDEFLEHVKSLSSMVLQPKNLLCKSNYVKLRSARALMNHVICCADQLCSGRLPDVITMTEAIIRSSCCEHYLRCLDLYDEKISEVISLVAFISLEQLQNRHQSAKDYAICSYKEKCPFTDTPQNNQFVRRLADVIETISYPRYRGMIELRQKENKVAKIYSSIWRKKAQRSKQLNEDNEKLPETVRKAVGLFIRKLEFFIDKRPLCGVKPPSDASNKSTETSELMKCVDHGTLEKTCDTTKRQILADFEGDEKQRKILEEEIGRICAIFQERNTELLNYIEEREQYEVQHYVCVIQKVTQQCSQDVTETKESFTERIARVIKQTGQNIKEEAMKDGYSEEEARRKSETIENEMEKATEKGRSFLQEHRDTIIAGTQVAGAVVAACVAFPLGGVPLIIGGIAMFGSYFGIKKVVKQISKKDTDDKKS